jgi:hypothetical protein
MIAFLPPVFSLLGLGFLQLGNYILCLLHLIVIYLLFFEMFKYLTVLDVILKQKF